MPATSSSSWAAGNRLCPPGGRHLVQPLLARVEPLPVETPLLRVAKRANGSYPVGRVGQEPRVPVQAGHGPVAERRVGKRAAIHPAGGVPVLEPRYLDYESAEACVLGHPRVHVDPQHPAAGRLELPGGDAGTDADVEHVGPGTGGDDSLHHDLGVAGPGPVVAGGVGAEGFRQLAGLMWFLIFPAQGTSSLVR
jgi:hypothetical protein